MFHARTQVPALLHMDRETAAAHLRDELRRGVGRGPQLHLHELLPARRTEGALKEGPVQARGTLRAQDGNEPGLDPSRDRGAGEDQQQARAHQPEARHRRARRCGEAPRA